VNLADIYEKVKPALVAFVIEEQKGTDIIYNIFGSGFCVDSDGIIVTAAHVITDYYKSFTGSPLPPIHPKVGQPIEPPKFRIVFFRKEKSAYGSVVIIPTELFIDSDNDIAVLGIPKCPDYWGNKWPHLELGDISRVCEGDEIATSGFPLKWRLPKRGSLPELSKGIVSAVVELPVGNNNWQTTKLVLDININPGNSGGPVFETRFGKVLGLVSKEVVRPPDQIPKSLESLFRIPTGIVYCVASGLVTRAVSELKRVSVLKSKELAQ